jgi:hypothetical protein
MTDNSAKKGFFRIALDCLVEARMREASRILARYSEVQRADRNSRG